MDRRIEHVTVAALIGLGRVLINRDRSHSPTDFRFAPTSGGKAAQQYYYAATN
jgi:hypothetical protein